MTKISIQYAGIKLEPAAGDTVTALKKAGVKYIKVVNDLGLLAAFAGIPGILRVFRDQAFQKNFQNGLDARLRQPGGPKACADQWVAHHLPLADANPGVVWEITNEWKAWDRVGGVWIIDHELTRLYAAFEAEVMRLMRSHGHTVCGWNFALSQPPYEAVPSLAASATAARQYGHYLGLHLYTSPSVTSSYGPEGRPEDFLYRYHEIERLYHLGVKWLGTEFFIDEVAGNGVLGWKKVMNANKAELELYSVCDPILNSHPELVAVFVYCAGRDGTSPDGKAEYDVLDSRGDYNLFPRIVSHIAADTTPAPIPPDPGPGPTPPPTGAGLYEVFLAGEFDRLNVRRGPGTTYTISSTLEDNLQIGVISISAGWAKLAGPAGWHRWVSATYLRRVP